MKRIFKLVIVVVILWVAYSLWFSRAISPVDSKSETRVPVTIEEGWALKTIADTLEEKKVIRSSFAFSRLAKKSDLAASLQAGSYVLSPNMSAREVMEALTQGKSSEEKITIPEGFTVSQIDALMVEKGFGQPGDILRCAYECDQSGFPFLPNDNLGDIEDGYGSSKEGFLFPDTYFVTRNGYTAEAFMKRLISTFKDRILETYGEEMDQSGRDFYDLIVMASLIEKETGADDERAIVAGILWKRFDEGMGLDVDATVRYFTGKITEPLTAVDLAADSPYNTRRYRGLPPGPISNFGVASFEAALRPEPSPYYYYLHGTDGQIRYARTNDEHNENKARYLR